MSHPLLTTSKKKFDVLDLGLCDYREYLKLQQELFKTVVLGNSRSILVFCEHSPVITLGRAGKRENILRKNEELKIRGIEVVNINRGGDVTLHLPGQLVVYPIFDLHAFGKDIRNFLRNLEEAAILLLEDCGIRARRRASLGAGVWVGKKKIASIGIAISRWVTNHGLGLNINCDLDLFSLIRPCGQDIMMTSMSELGCFDIKMPEIKTAIASKFDKVF